MKKIALICLGLISPLFFIIPIALADPSDQPTVTAIMISIALLIPPFVAFLFPHKLLPAPEPSPPKDIHGANFVIEETKDPTILLGDRKQAALSQLGEISANDTHPSLDLLASVMSPTYGLAQSGMIYDCIVFLGWMRTLIVSVVLLISPVLTVAGGVSLYITGTCALFGYMLLIGVIATRKLR